MTEVVTGALRVDRKRRTTLPSDVLLAAGIPAGSPLVARVEEQGRIVLESPQLLLSRLQDDITAALAAGSGVTVAGDMLSTSLAAELLADRAVDTSLDDFDPPAEADG